MLSDRTIEEYIEAGRIGVEPEITDQQVSPASLDVRIGGQLYDVYRDEYRDFDGTVVIQPWTFYLGHTMDRIDLPDDIVAELAGRSSLGREGLVVHKTAGIIDPGYIGQITLEIFNFSLEPIELEVGERVGQLTFHETDRETRGYDGKYVGDTGPVESRR